MRRADVKGTYQVHDLEPQYEPNREREEQVEELSWLIWR